jgi:demethylmenaquinone methyltransferase/2-methoxy-6-polyprenyl-1,4-benzoquinol methylase
LLDLATGTGDILLTFLKKRKDISLATGLDMSANMLLTAEKKIKKNGLDEKTNLIRGDANSIPFDNEKIDITTMSFGIRNISSPIITLKEINRVLKRGGKVFILEFSIPRNKIMKFFFLL